MALSDVPLATQTLSVSQNPIRQNFLDVGAQFAIDHVAFNTVGNGWHNQITFPRQAGLSATAGTNIALFSNVGATSAVSELVFRRQGNGQSIAFTEFVGANTGWTRLILVWGTGNITSNAAAITVTFPLIGGIAPFQAASCFMVSATAAGVPAIDNQCIQVGTITNANFQMFCRAIAAPNGMVVPYKYFAIGLGV